MMMNKEAIKIGFAYVGIVVGAGFSTGQEVMQFSLNMACGLI
ncbi:membrane spanning protein [Staphylococcus aureus]|nr:membrane spanning protein [Staphylococcus aureus]